MGMQLNYVVRLKKNNYFNEVCLYRLSISASDDKNVIFLLVQRGYLSQGSF